VKDICTVFNIPETAAIVTGFERKNLFLSTMPVAASERTAKLISQLKVRVPASTIVYVTLQATAESIAQALSKAGLPSRAYHAGMKDDERTEVQEWWKRSPQNIVVATIAFGMGIDKADVRYVYHYNLPKGLESYSQEIGRAGRDGQPSIVEILGGEDDVVTLENFAYGDTPTREAVTSLLRDLLARKGTFDVSIYSLSSQHDIRPLVLRTALTYLELLQALRQGTPFYAGYKVRLQEPISKLLERFQGERAEFVKAIFEQSKLGREWYTIDPESLAGQLGQERDRVIKAIDYLGEKSWAEIQVSDARQQYTSLLEKPDLESFVDKLMEKFSLREQQETKRIQQVLQLISNPGCWFEPSCGSA
jgi:ATP-dependent DNA helicase RecQ